MALTSVLRVRPQTNFSINRSNTLATGLITYINAVTGRDILNYNKPTPVGSIYNGGIIKGSSFGRGSVKVRGYGTVHGTSSGDIIQQPLATGLPLARTYCIWVFIRSSGSSSVGRIFHIGDVAPAFFCFFDGAAIYVYRGDALGSTGQFSVNFAAVDLWHCFGVSHDGTTAAPVVYINGIPQTVTTTTAMSAGAIAINEIHGVGNRPDLFDRDIDGMLSDFVGWGRVLTAKEHWDYYVNSWNILKSANPIQSLDSIVTPPSGYHPGMWHVFI